MISGKAAVNRRHKKAEQLESLLDGGMIKGEEEDSWCKEGASRWSREHPPG